MTIEFRQKIQCSHCNKWTTIENPFGRWMRNEPRLDSQKEGLVTFDGDIIVHRYKFYQDKKGDRTIQSLMFVEVKFFNAKLSESQQDTLSLFSQILRNQKSNEKSKPVGKLAENHVPLTKAYSRKSGKMIQLRLFGYHLITLSDSSPDKSKTITWDYKLIKLDQLIQLLLFELNPYTLRPMDWRRHHRQCKLPLFS